MTKYSEQGNILFVDDEERIREFAKEMLEGMGYSVAACEDGRTALIYYRKTWESVDLVILDMIMPGMGGREVFDLMREINPDVKVIISSGLNNDISNIFRTGGCWFIQKPFRAEELLALIDEGLKGKEGKEGKD